MKNFKEIFRGKKTLSSSRKKSLEDFALPLGLKFKDWELLDLAFHHRSYSNESRDYKRCNNERLEFLGDSVLGLVTASFLYEDIESSAEGDLAKIKSQVVSEKALAPVAKKFGIDKMLVLGRGEEMTGGRTKPAILADCMEAVIGAYYLDSGYIAAEKYVLQFIVPAVRAVQEGKSDIDYKSELQEMYQKKCGAIPRYELLKTTGPDHEKTFYYNVYLGKKCIGPAHGKNKKEAEQNVARMALESLKS